MKIRRFDGLQLLPNPGGGDTDPGFQPLITNCFFIMKKVFKTILAVVCLTALFLTAGEYPDGSVGIWNFSWLAVAALSAFGLKKMEEAK